MPSLSQLYILSLQHKALTSALWNQVLLVFCVCVFLVVGAFHSTEELEPLRSPIRLPAGVAGLPITAMPCCQVSTAMCFLGSNWSKSFFGEQRGSAGFVKML